MNRKYESEMVFSLHELISAARNKTQEMILKEKEILEQKISWVDRFIGMKGYKSILAVIQKITKEWGDLDLSKKASLEILLKVLLIFISSAYEIINPKMANLIGEQRKKIESERDSDSDKESEDNASSSSEEESEDNVSSSSEEESEDEVSSSNEEETSSIKEDNTPGSLSNPSEKEEDTSFKLVKKFEWNSLSLSQEVSQEILQGINFEELQSNILSIISEIVQDSEIYHVEVDILKKSLLLWQCCIFQNYGGLDFSNIDPVSYTHLPKTPKPQNPKLLNSGNKT